MRRSLVLLSLLGVVLSGCGGDDGSITAKDSGDTTETTEAAGGGDSESSGDADALAASLLDSDMPIEEADAQCAAEAMVGNLSAEGLKIVGSDSGSPTDLSDDDAEVVKAAFNDCVAFDVFGGAILDGFTGADTPFTLTDEERTCASAALEESIGGSGDLLFAMDDLSEDAGATVVLDAIGGCISKDSLVPALSSLFSKDGTMDEATGTCIAEALVSEFGGTELFRNFAQSADGSMPADLQSAVEKAATDCALAGVGGGIGG